MKNYIMKIKDEIWVLCDNRPGTSSQAIGLADKIGLEYKIINLQYNFCAKIPNFLFKKSLIRLAPKSKTELKLLSQDYLPRIVISSGRRAASVALFIKKISKNQTKVIQIMNPDCNFTNFDYVILPTHDGVKSKSENLITTIGSLTKIDNKIINDESVKFESWFQDIANGKIALLIGGSSNNTYFDSDSAKKLAQISSKIAKEMDATLLVLTSRRTDNHVIEEIKNNLDCNHKIFLWENSIKANPYLAILGYADFFIVSGDSVSMISECCSTGKPVYIFDDKEISSQKHRKFHDDLIKNDYAKRLDYTTKKLEKFFYKKLDETKKVATIIRKNILID